MQTSIIINNVTLEQLFFVCTAIDIDFPLPPQDKKRSLLSYYSMLEDVRQKLQKKFISGKAGKKIKITLRHHEANALYETLCTLGYEREAQPVFDQLHQKLT